MDEESATAAPNAAAEPAPAEDALIHAIIGLLETTNSPAIQRAREIIAHRLAISGDIAPSRVPPPLNITEIGGYINLLTDYGEEEQRARLIAAALGIAGPAISLPPPGQVPPLFFAERAQVRPDVPQQSTFTLSYTMRSDFVAAFEAALAQVAASGGALPVLTPLRTLPPLSVSVAPGLAQLELIGRRLILAPTAALSDPAQDPLSVSRPAAGGAFSVRALVLDAAAPAAPGIAAADWTSWQCTSEACEEVETNDARFEISPMLNSAGWVQPDPISDPVTMTDPGNWANWINITGLVPGSSIFGDEISALYTTGQVLQSTVRDMMTLVWDGDAFV